jgi:hypothetical protein
LNGTRHATDPVAAWKAVSDSGSTTKTRPSPTAGIVRVFAGTSQSNVPCSMS